MDARLIEYTRGLLAFALRSGWKDRRHLQFDLVALSAIPIVAWAWLLLVQWTGPGDLVNLPLPIFAAYAAIRRASMLRWLRGTEDDMDGWKHACRHAAREREFRSSSRTKLVCVLLIVALVAVGRTLAWASGAQLEQPDWLWATLAFFVLATHDLYLEAIEPPPPGMRREAAIPTTSVPQTN